MRYQSAIPMSAFRGDDLGFLRRSGHRRRRRLRRKAERIARKQEAELERVPAPRRRRAERKPREDDEWGPLTRLGQQLRIQARRGHRAAVVELQPGMFLVAEVPEESLRPEVGVAPLLAPLLTLAAQRALMRRRDRHPDRRPRRHCRRREPEVLEPEVIYEPPPPRQLPGPVAPVPWAEVEDVQEVISGCACTRGRG